MYKWKSTEYITQFLEQLRLDLLENNQASTVGLNISLDRNYGFIVKTRDNLNKEDHLQLKEYMVDQLKSHGYKVNREVGEEILLQASVRARVNGNQLFGTTKLIDKGYEIRILVTPYNDRYYGEVSEKRELVDLLFG